MKLTIIDAARARGLIEPRLGGALDSPEGIADLIRHEVSARGRCPRHHLLLRVCRLAAGTVSLSPEQVGEICDELRREGDLLLAEGGLVHPAPIRIIALGAQVFRFVCAVPSIDLFKAVPGQWSQRRARRECTPTQAIEGVASALGAVVLTPAVWAGFDRMPSADAEWIQGLDARLSSEPEPAGSLEHDGALEWLGHDDSSGEPRWRAMVSARLWRARHVVRRWVYAWTAGASPQTAPFVSLYPDEGARSAFAHARAIGVPLRASVSRKGERATLDLPGWLPLAEYRYLSTCAEHADSHGRRAVWVVPLARLPVVRSTLEARLGLSFAEDSA